MISQKGKMGVYSSVLAVILIAGMANFAFAADDDVNACGAISRPVINVVERVKNDVDSGMAGNNWAFDNYTRRIRVWAAAGVDTYCATVDYEGHFQGVALQRSPGDTIFLNGTERGPFQGGYVAIITGPLLGVPLWKLHGSVGTVNYGCDILGTCPGYVSWLGQYFTPGFGFRYLDWGWTYRGPNGVWINAAAGSFGDITP